jgi:serine/threonine protein phosphatase PrpC
MGINNSNASQIDVGSSTHTGVVRAENQDSIGRFEAHRAGETWNLLIICDGMGGHQGGSKASKVAVDAIGTMFMKEMSSGSPVSMTLSNSIKFANNEIQTAAKNSPNLQGMGTTCVMLAASEQQAWIAHVGDSRCYRIRPGEIDRLTNDHSNVQRLIDADMITESDARDHPDSTVLYRCLGVKPEVEVTVTGPIPVKEGDRFLLCSDGLHGFIEENIIGAFALMDEPQIATEKLIELANRRGGMDNVSVQILYRPGKHAPTHTFTPEKVVPRASSRTAKPSSGQRPSELLQPSWVKYRISLIGSAIGGVALTFAVGFLLAKFGIITLKLDPTYRITQSTTNEITKDIPPQLGPTFERTGGLPLPILSKPTEPSKQNDKLKAAQPETSDIHAPKRTINENVR